MPFRAPLVVSLVCSKAEAGVTKKLYAWPQNLLPRAGVAAKAASDRPIAPFMPPPSARHTDKNFSHKPRRSCQYPRKPLKLKKRGPQRPLLFSLTPKISPNSVSAKDKSASEACLRSCLNCQRRRETLNICDLLLFNNRGGISWPLLVLLRYSKHKPAYSRHIHSA